MSEDGDFKIGVDTRDLVSGWQGIIHHGDGTATKVWALTEAEAERKARQEVENAA